MDATDVTEVCRLCPSSGGGHNLLNVFDKSISFKYNIREVILIYTGIEILENDLVSKKICQRCCSILYKMYEFRLDALKQDRKLKDKCGCYLGDKGIRLPNTCVTIKKENFNSNIITKIIKNNPDKVQPSRSSLSLTSNEDLKKRLHPSVAEVFKNYPTFKLPKKCFERNMAPIVSLPMGEVEKYFKKRKLDIRKFIYKPCARIQAPSKVAKKKTSPSTRPKTIAPLKISRKQVDSTEEPEGRTHSNYVCVSVPKEEKSRKRKISSDSDRSVESKLSRNIDSKSFQTPQSDTEKSKPPTNNLHDSKRPLTPILKSKPDASGTTLPVKTPSPAPLLNNSRSPSPAPADPISEDSRDSCSTNISEANTLNSLGEPEFLDSFGLIPTVKTTKSYTLHTCNLCGSVNHSAYELKKHLSKHMVCQFCKLKFKSIESKQNHVDHLCPIKKVMNSSGPLVKLEKIHLNLDVRKKYPAAFTNFELIPGLLELIPVEQVILKAESPPNIDDAVIVLSDDDETHPRTFDPLSDIPTHSSNMLSPAIDNVVYNTVSIVKPDIRIKNNTILNGLVENMTDKQLLKDLIELFRPSQPTTVETMIQTDLPANKDIQINNVEDTCEFKDLKGQLATYKIPITINHGAFHAFYQFKNSSKKNKQMAVWDDLPVIDIGESNSKSPKENGSELGNSLDKNPSLIGTTQTQSSDVAVSLVPMIPITTSIILPNTSISAVSAVTSNGLATVQTPVNHLSKLSNLAIPINSRNILINTANSATPLLQNYALSMPSGPVISNPIPIPRTYVNSALSKTTSTSNRSIPLATGSNFISKPQLSTVITTYNRPLPTSNLTSVSRPHNTLVVNSSSPSSFLVVQSQPSHSFQSTNNPLSFSTVSSPSCSLPKSNPLPSPTVLNYQISSNSLLPQNNPLTPAITVVQETNSLTSTFGKPPNSTPSEPEMPKFRVKSVWELQ